MPYADVPGVRLFYTDSGEGSPVLLVHGYTCDGTDWCYQVPALEQKHRVINVDLRGHGRSSAPESGYTPRQYAADLAALLKALDCGPVVAAGHSMGGATVVALAVEHPAAVRAIVPVDSAYGQAPESRERLDRLASGVAGPDGHAIAAQMFAGFYPPAAPRHLAAWHTRRVLGTPSHVLAQAFHCLFAGHDSFAFKPEADAYLQRVACPALAFRAGSQDPSGVAAWERSNFVHPYSKAVAWEGTGHFLHQERPAEFNAILDAWIDGLPA